MSDKLKLKYPGDERIKELERALMIARDFVEQTYNHAPSVMSAGDVLDEIYNALGDKAGDPAPD